MSELMSRLGGQNLAFYPQVAMVIFLAVFVAVTIRLWRQGSRGADSRAASMPLEDAPTITMTAHTTTEASR